MALRRLPQIIIQASRNVQLHRQIHVSAVRCGFFDAFKKPMPRQEDIVVGYSKIIMDAKKAGEDPLETENRDDPSSPLGGTGTRNDPFLIPSRNTRRYCLVENPKQHGGPPKGFWVTLEDGGRCPVTAQYYKLQYDPSDKWGIDELDLFKH